MIHTEKDGAADDARLDPFVPILPPAPMAADTPDAVRAAWREAEAAQTAFAQTAQAATSDVPDEDAFAAPADEPPPPIQDPAVRAIVGGMRPSGTDPNGSYTGRPVDENELPQQDADDL